MQTIVDQFDKMFIIRKCLQIWGFICLSCCSVNLRLYQLGGRGNTECPMGYREYSD
jgi:hypothetical protein